MRTAELTALKRITVTERPIPEVKTENDVLIKIQSVGICGSDVHYYAEGGIGDQRVQFPWIVGHECSGVVEKTGQRVAIDPCISCGTCDQCAAGRHHTCRNQMFLGCPGQLEGCLAEYIVMPASACYTIPDNLSFEDAALCEPLSIGMYAVDLYNRPQYRSAAVLGAGPIGLSVMLALQAAGTETIYVTDPLEYRTRAAESKGAAWSGNPDDLTQNITPGSVDIIFECCGKQDAFDQAVELCRPGGTIAIVGIPEFDRYSLDAHTSRRKELIIGNVRRQNGFVDKALQAVADGTIDPRFMKTHNFGLNEVEKGFQLVDQYQDNIIKAIINI